MLTGSQFERALPSVDVFEPADLREKKMQYLYKEGDKFCFMDNETFEQVTLLTREQVGDAVNFLLDNDEASNFSLNRPIGISLPNFVRQN